MERHVEDLDIDSRYISSGEAVSIPKLQNPLDRRLRVDLENDTQDPS
jgi:hypothetical protein